jgi:hypothetical protein
MTIKQKQCLLYFLGYYVGKIDGDWGTLSKIATKAFQKDFGGLVVDGIAGDATVKAMKHAVAYGMPEKKDNSAPAKSADWWDEIKYFKKAEFSCKCGKYCNGHPTEMNQKVVKAADKVREHFGVEAIVTSGLRCSQHNANVGGVSNSRHKQGKAIDFRVTGKTAAQVLVYVKTLPEIRYCYAIDNTHVHMDVV